MAQTLDKNTGEREALNAAHATGTNGPDDSSIVDVPGTATDASRAPASEAPVQSKGLVRWVLAVVVASIVALPFGWILSYAAALPFMIGTFFFAVLGLIIGAVAFRVGLGGRPYHQTTIILGTTVIVLIGWGYSIHVEARDLPRVLGEKAADEARDLKGQTREQFEASIAGRVQDYLATNFAPGGTIGYIRWVMDKGSIPAEDVPGARRALSVQQTGWVWLIRATMSLGLMAFGIASQTLPLASVKKVDPVSAT